MAINRKSLADPRPVLIILESQAMNTRNIALSLALGAALSSTPALAEGYRGYSDAGRYDYAPVVDVQPLYRTVTVSTPRQECWDEPVNRYQVGAGDSYTPTIIGGIVGGVVGNQFGKGTGRDVATVAGALLGGSIGRDLGYRSGGGQYYSDVERRCRTVNDSHTEQRVEGYNVTYRYGGRTYTTRTDYDPGRQIKVRVDVVPVLN